LVELADVALTYFVARRIFKQRFMAVVAAGLMALTPAHFIYSRLAVSRLYPLPFVLAWLLSVATFEERGRLSFLCAGACILGIGVYANSASVVLMPACLLLTCLAIHLEGRGTLRSYSVAVAGFILPVLPFIAWHLRHPELHIQQISSHSLYDATRLDPLQGLSELMNVASLTERSSVYWDYFNPSFLFLSAGTSLTEAMRDTGVFLFPIAVVLPVGLYRIATHRHMPLALLLPLGLLSAPLASTLLAERYQIHRALLMLPFAILIATVGVEVFLSARKRAWRLVGYGLLALIPIQFVVFLAGYVTDHRVQSSTVTATALGDVGMNNRFRPVRQAISCASKQKVAYCFHANE
jgi:hypothetical protein